MDHTKVDAKTMKKWESKEIYLYAEDQKNFGIVDHIVENLNEIL